ncbi:hypothetical protein AGMMS49579_01260 [Spirochaetia bacterium]|nr:hypothetical protein AGMMS49579_01260 [Spirochaetia bacterium]
MSIEAALRRRWKLDYEYALPLYSASSYSYYPRYNYDYNYGYNYGYYPQYSYYPSYNYNYGYSYY